jgi:hypothetical protein
MTCRVYGTVTQRIDIIIHLERPCATTSTIHCHRPGIVAPGLKCLKAYIIGILECLDPVHTRTIDCHHCSCACIIFLIGIVPDHTVIWNNIRCIIPGNRKTGMRVTIARYPIDRVAILIGAYVWSIPYIFSILTCIRRRPIKL